MSRFAALTLRKAVPTPDRADGYPRELSFLSVAEPRRTAIAGALSGVRAAILRRRVLTGSPPALERRLIAFPKAQDKAS